VSTRKSEPRRLCSLTSSSTSIILKQHGRAAIVVPDNVLFEGGAGECLRESAFKIQGGKLA